MADSLNATASKPKIMRRVRVHIISEIEVHGDASATLTAVNQPAALCSGNLETIYLQNRVARSNPDAGETCTNLQLKAQKGLEHNNNKLGVLATNQCHTQQQMRVLYLDP